MFEDLTAFDPDKNSKVPLKRTPVALLVRWMVLSARLIFSRHPTDYVRWTLSMLLRRHALKYPLPWITFGAAREMACRISPAATIFEFGAGNSTLFWASRVEAIWAVDDNEDWFHLLDRKVAECGFSNVHLVLAQDKNSYLDALSKSGQPEFDVVVVDGAHRRECVLAAVPYVKSGGLLVVDNTDWHWFQSDPIQGIPQSWDKKAFPGYAPMMGYESETTIYIRPKGAPAVERAG